MPDPVRWLTVQHGPHTVDLALPSDVPIGLLLPSIVDLFGRGAADETCQWHLSLVGQQRLDESTSLYDNAISDGELLVLTTTVMPAPVFAPDDPWRVVVETADNDCARRQVSTTTICAFATALGSAALMWSGTVTHAVSHVNTAGVIAAATASAARLVRSDAIVAVTLAAIAVVFAGVAGFLVVPGDSTTANGLLASAVASTLSILLLRIIGCGTVCLTALAALSALASAASACAVALTLSVTATGALLTTLGLGALAAAAKLSIAVAGLAPAMSGSDDRFEESRAVNAHQTLTGLVLGSVGATALGSALAAVESRGAMLAAVAGVAVLLRSRTHIDALRRTALILGGTVAIASSCVHAVICAPEQANWVCLLGTAVSVWVLCGGIGMAANPLVRRAIEALEYLALAAVIPLACWVAGLYASVRGLSLP